jgi:N-acylneuraminate cytidylyltransferase
MINGKKVLGVIPARGGSKGVPRKNIRIVGDKPLIAWTIEEAKKSRYLDRLIVSSEDAEIIRMSEQWGCEAPFERPAALATDNISGVDPVLHSLQELPGYDYVVLLQPTSPLRSVEDIDGCIDKCISTNAKSCVSVTEPENNPYWMYLLGAEGKMKPLIETEDLVLRRQDLPKVYALNGAVYVAENEWLMRERSFLAGEPLGYEMPQERSLDIDTELDLKVFEALVATRETLYSKHN